jgi:serine/threonine protein kinase
MATLVSDTYYQSQNRVLPFKWASVEVLKFGKYSTASDVWAFGVTLWELFSLGAQPYAGSTNAEASELVLSGKRLTKPDRCPEAVFAIMLRCWQEKTKERPSMLEVYEGMKGLEEKPKITTTTNTVSTPDEFYTLYEEPNKDKVIYHM